MPDAPCSETVEFLAFPVAPRLLGNGQRHVRLQRAVVLLWRKPGQRLCNIQTLVHRLAYESDKFFTLARVPITRASQSCARKLVANEQRLIGHA